MATCNGAGEGRLEGRRFRIVVLDEASQATEAASLVALIKGAVCVVMAGERAGWAGLGWAGCSSALGGSLRILCPRLANGTCYKEVYHTHP